MKWMYVRLINISEIRTVGLQVATMIIISKIRAKNRTFWHADVLTELINRLPIKIVNDLLFEQLTRKTLFINVDFMSHEYWTGILCFEVILLAYQYNKALFSNVKFLFHTHFDKIFSDFQGNKCVHVLRIFGTRNP